MKQLRFLTLTCLLLASTDVRAQFPFQKPNATKPTPPAPPANPLQLPQPAPVLHVRIDGPRGMLVTVFQGRLPGITLNAPCVVGFRPGYGYRFAIHNLDKHPQKVFFPQVDVIASLTASQGLKPSDHPAGLFFSDEDLTRVSEGLLLRKVIALEHPDVAIPQASQADRPLEVSVAANMDPIIEARHRGQPVAIVSVGARHYSAEDLVAISVPGTMLLPGEKDLGPPAASPWFDFECYAIGDPLVGKRRPSDFTALYDGGDVGLQAGFNRQGKLRGIDPTDTVAEFEDASGRRKVAISNRVSLCIPRFIVLRSESVLASQITQLSTKQMQGRDGYTLVGTKQPVFAQQQNLRLELAQRGLRASGMDMLQGVAVTGRLENVEIKMTPLAPADFNGLKLVEPPEPECPLIIIKWPDKYTSHVGDIVTFFLQASNHGKKPISNVAIVDSLQARFEYVAGSSKADRLTNFTTQPNETGSVILRWELADPLPPGESAMVQFQVRVR